MRRSWAVCCRAPRALLPGTVMEALVSTSVSEDVEDGKTQTKESQLRQILGGNAKHGAAMDSAASASVVGVVLGEDPYTGAAIKLEELFFYWLSQKETVEMVEGYVSAVVQGQAVPLEMTSEVGDGPCTNITYAPSFRALSHCHRLRM